MPKTKGTKTKAATKQQSVPQSPTPSVNELDGVRVESDDGDTGNQDAVAKCKRVYNSFTDRQEELLVEWLQDNPIVYNKGLKEYTEKAKKAALCTEIVVKVDVPGM
jgi:hypothetical protein